MGILQTITGKGITMSPRGVSGHSDLKKCRCGLADLVCDSGPAATRAATVADQLGLPVDLARMVYLAWLLWHHPPRRLTAGVDKPPSKTCYAPTPTDPPGAPEVRLSQREMGVAQLIAQGKTNHAIAVELGIGERTVETHVSHILAKLGFAARAQIAAWVVGQDRTANP